MQYVQAVYRLPSGAENITPTISHEVIGMGSTVYDHLV